MSTISNQEAIAAWSKMPAAAMDAHDDQGDFVKRHLVNDNLLRMLGDIRNRRVLDAGCGQGYFSRILRERGAQVVGVEPSDAMITRAREIEDQQPGTHRIDYVQADLSDLGDVGQPFDAVVCSMVLLSIPDWQTAMASCVHALKPGGTFVFSIVHPAFENLLGTWLEHGEYRTKAYLDEYEIHGTHAPDFHRPLSAYLNELAGLGCRLKEIAEPGLDPQVAQNSGIAGIESHVYLPTFLIVAAERES